MRQKATQEDARPRALVVDGCSFQRQLLTLICRTAGFETLEAGSGRKAIDLMAKAPCSLLVTDLDLPELDGFQLLHHMADSGGAADLLLVSSQGHSILNSADRLARTLNFNVIGALEKPIIAEDMLDLLNGRCDKPSMIELLGDPRQGPTMEPLSHSIIEQGITNGSLVAFYQPKIHHQDSAIVGFECLARWRTAEGLILEPGAFLPMVEELGLMTSLTQVMLNHAIKDIAAWQTLGWPMPVSVNLSADSMTDTNLPDRLAWLVAENGVRPTSITLEITETKLMEEAAECLEVMSRLRLKGFGLSVDDFGTGYSTLKQLQYFPFTELKLDQSYVRSSLSHQPSRAVLETGIQLARSLSLSCVAEGVETTDHADLLASLGCHNHQGYLYGKPMPAADIPVWIAGWLERGGTMMAVEPEIAYPTYLSHRPIGMPDISPRGPSGRGSPLSSRSGQAG
ncbi:MULTISPECIES: EAL domain-containing response regulator [Kordiimonas]|jgi:EAL domain-containing protein (putative c-di-GMP-specific phosphodiesterase class I)|uniref:EAL domain-containing response regulator n=1 Tax=Kordiimonas TaxID=288021 RepID=UPI00257B9AA4|nr:EAL domain-containing response regulator [Kordiimonas sp. UBA4487]